MASVKRTFSFVIAGLTCPCHLPIYLALLGGTALGGVIRENMGLVFLGLTGAFVVSLLFGIRTGEGERAQRSAVKSPADHDEVSAESAGDRAVSGRAGSP